MNKYIYTLAVTLMFSLSAMAQSQVVGTVKNQRGTPMEGVAISSVAYPQNKAITNKRGEFAIAAAVGEYIQISYAGNEGGKLWVENDVLEIVLTNKDIVVKNIGEHQNSYRQTQAISTISGDVLSLNGTLSPSNAMYGQLAGLAVRQNTGWTDGASFMIRGGGSINGTAPLIIIDGIQRSMSNVNVHEIESVSVLKDGAATAVWGTRGANGVVLITTKRGAYNTTNIDVNYQRGVGLPINQPKFADGYTYAMAQNEALYYDGLPAQYNADALLSFKDGANRDLYSNTDWLSEGLRDQSVNNQFDITLNGGGGKLRYYSLINYKNDYGILKDNLVNNKDYTAQMRKYELSARINIDVDVTPSTLVSISMAGILRETKRPNTNEDDMFGGLYHVPSAAFPIRNSRGNWASNSMYKYNPIARIADVGYSKRNQRTLQSNLNILQSLSMLTEGLSAKFGIAYDTDAIFQETASRKYLYEIASSLFDPITGLEKTVFDKYDEDTNLSYSNGGLAANISRVVLDGNIAYDRAFGLHAVSGMIQYNQEAFITTGRNNNLYRQSVMLVAGYNYNDKYMVDVVVNRSGTSVLSTGDKFRTYPAVSAAWVVSNENFMSSKNIDYLKLRASWGRSGNDNTGYDLDKQFWGGSGGYNFNSNNTGFGGMSEGDLAITNLTCEMADKYNIGVDMQLFKNLSLTVDGFVDQREKSLISSNTISSAIGIKVPKQNIGSMNTKGVELSLMWSENKKDFSYYVGGNFSYLKNEIIENGEGFKQYGYQSRIGGLYGQVTGLESIGYFNDVEEIANSPIQRLGSDVRPGDIKYKDQNGDNIIDGDDVVAIGNSNSVPGIYYGINVGFEYKGFGIDMVFQGLGKYSKMLNTKSVYWPLRNGNSNISSWYLEDKIRWTEQTKETANVPRLTTVDNSNNFRNSTQWLADASYFKLRNLNIYYNLPQKWVKPIGLEKLQIYVRANNLFSIDDIDYMNAEDFSINYPDMTSIYLGINVNF